MFCGISLAKKTEKVYEWLIFFCPEKVRLFLSVTFFSASDLSMQTIFHALHQKEGRRKKNYRQFSLQYKTSVKKVAKICMNKKPAKHSRMFSDLLVLFWSTKRLSFEMKTILMKMVEMYQSKVIYFSKYYSLLSIKLE